MLKKQIEAWVIQDIGLTEFDNWNAVIRFANRLSIRNSIIACFMVAGMLAVMHAFDLLLNPLWRDMAIGCSIAVVVAFVLTMLCSLYMGYAVIHLARTRLEFRQLSRTDMLSGLLNRRAFIDDLSQVERGHLLILDIDRFKQINDRYGHMAGDDVIISVAATLTEIVGPSHLVARIGGEEFAILFQDCEFAEVVSTAECIRRSIANRLIEAFHQSIAVTVSGGLADITPMRDFSAVYAAADRALYAAKSSGRNRIVLERELPRGAAVEPTSLDLTNAAMSLA
ncbi:GGDEF domain-containing protein [Rhizobium rosettiformans]|uniref:GGDEF domain-containing protein n=1 Tax=Rhizobium rosettiformans TaxID=1368430 RepID=UPI0028550D9B|nr:GGDEF domain-containing protein [Rhizobium rosettiformans]MDR7029912.1 diguanylate cyclase (GGDEF)-like protein [Rhizobium rosettiformans]MDR7063626.1 diguanylate cyclase (GGDEF)-like protein [Rhizobium rosettiformans]